MLLNTGVKYTCIFINNNYLHLQLCVFSNYLHLFIVSNANYILKVQKMHLLIYKQSAKIKRAWHNTKLFLLFLGSNYGPVQNQVFYWYILICIFDYFFCIGSIIISNSFIGTDAKVNKHCKHKQSHRRKNKYFPSMTSFH